MQDVNTPIRKAYYQLISSNVTLNGLPVEVYDKMAPNDAVYPYIILSTQTDSDDSVKGCQGHDPTILIDVVTGKTGEVSSVDADNISGQILGLINPAGSRLILTGSLTLIRTQLISDNTIEGQNGVYKILRRLLRFGHKVHEQVQI